MTQANTGVLERPRDKTPPLATDRASLIEQVATSLARPGQQSVCFRALYDVESMSEQNLRATSVMDSAFEPVAAILNPGGTPSDYTVGSLMDQLELSKDDVHGLVCYCQGETITGATFADRFRKLNAM